MSGNPPNVIIKGHLESSFKRAGTPALPSKEIFHFKNVPNYDDKDHAMNLKALKQEEIWTVTEGNEIQPGAILPIIGMSGKLSRHSDLQLYEMLTGDPQTKERAFAELYTRYSSRIWLYCLKVMGDSESASDMFQGTFLRFLQSVQVDREMTNVPAFLLRIARNLCLNEKQKMRPVAMPFEALEIPVEDASLESKELARLVSTALDLLPEEYREAFVLQTYNGLSYKEIAEVINHPVSTVRNRVVRAKKKIREILSPYLVDYRQ